MKEGIMQFALALMGKGGSGKSTAARRVVEIATQAGIPTALVNHDRMRQQFAPVGADPFPSSLEERYEIYRPVNEYCRRLLESGQSIVLDAAVSREPCRAWIKREIPGLIITWIDCPLPVAVLRETWRSLRDRDCDRDTFLYARAIVRRLFRPRSEWIHMPPVTAPFDPPHCADLRVSSLIKSPDRIAREVLTAVGVVPGPSSLHRCPIPAFSPKTFSRPVPPPVGFVSTPVSLITSDMGKNARLGELQTPDEMKSRVSSRRDSGSSVNASPQTSKIARAVPENITTSSL
jgi:adenylylsulfate kinase-like enzyme